MTITKRRRDVLAFIVNYVREHDYAPSIREIANGLGVSSPATVHEHLEGLRQDGYIAGSGSRACMPTESTLGIGKSFVLPLLGIIAAGQPIEAVQQRDAIVVPADFVVDGMNSYVLRVQGESMIEDGIFDGDYVVVERNPSPKNGDVVVALLQNEYATLKRFYREPNRIRLEPANATMRPIYVRDCIVQGVVKAVMRRY
ncbi:MAG: transcriptional repressor LexA [Candidatus Uhrbacteria bacterium]